ncbi:MAG: isopentenyl phosphate kinase [Thermoplasmata archaeon]
MKLVKLGGSVITFKGERRRFRSKITEELAGELTPFKEELCIVHGGGSYGHPLAHRYELHRGLHRQEQLAGFAEVHRSMRELNGRVLRALQSHTIPAVSIPPAPLVSMEGGEVVSFTGGPFQRYLDAGLVPVTFGDVVLDSLRGSAVLSGDDLMLLLARVLKPVTTIFVADVDGVKGPDGTLLPVVSSTLSDVPLLEDEMDVTGGLRRKLSLMLQMAKEGFRCLIISGLARGRLRGALEGRDVPCTEVRWA